MDDATLDRISASDNAVLPFVEPPSESGRRGFVVYDGYKPFTRDDLSIGVFEDGYLSNTYCPGLAWDVHDTGALSIVNCSVYPVFIAKIIPGRSIGRTYTEVANAARNPQTVLGSTSFGGILPELADTERTDEEIDKRLRTGFPLDANGAKYRVAVGRPPEWNPDGKQSPEYVLVVHTPGRDGPPSGSDLACTLPADEDRLAKMSTDAKAAEAMRDYLLDNPQHRYFLAYREHQTILGKPNPVALGDAAVKRQLGDRVVSGVATFKAITGHLANKCGIQIGKFVTDSGQRHAVSQWLVDNGALTVQDVRDVDMYLRHKKGPGYTSLFDS